MAALLVENLVGQIQLLSHPFCGGYGSHQSIQGFLNLLHLTFIQTRLLLDVGLALFKATDFTV